ncbi:ribosomal protein S30-domain-containing protein [Lanmaoa asiatica]|nr:ribosomal protein S30-domain-containing protein [Lanmaoa asiatica]
MGKGVYHISRIKCAPIRCSSHLVHGSLARAGKVKSQTPKVEKQEKEKPPTGRAKKRELYNRRQAHRIRPPSTGR